MRVDPQILNALKRWAEDDMRSMNGQVEFLLRQALFKAGRLKPDDARDASQESTNDSNSVDDREE